MTNFIKQKTLPGKSPAGQQGVALIIVLGMLSIIFVIASISIRLTLLAERSARNDRDRQIAFQAAEAALSDAELDIMGPNSAVNKRCSMNSKQIELFDEGCGFNTTDKSRGLCASNPPGVAYKPLYSTINFDETNDGNRRYVLFGEFTGRTSSLKSSAEGGVSSKTPRYIIELVTSYKPYVTTNAPGGNATTNVTDAEPAFLVTAVGYGVSDSTRVMLQTLIFKPIATPGC